jgi:hypothetical protein
VRRREFSGALLGSATSAGLPTASCAQPRDCGTPCYAQTAAESAANVTPVAVNWPPGHPDRYQVNTTPGTTDMSAGFAFACMQARQAGGAPVRVANPSAISRSVTVPSEVPLIFSGAGSVNIVGSRVTLTIQGHISGPRNTLFLGDGTLAFTQSAQPEVYPEWWGCRGDSMVNTHGGFTFAGTDCTSGLAACILAAAGGEAVNVGIIPIRLGNGYYMTGNQTLPPSTVIRGLGRETCGFIAREGTAGATSGPSAGAWFTDSGNAAKIILEDFAMYGAYAASPAMVYALRLGYNGVPHGTEGYLRGLWIRDCACYTPGQPNGFQCDILGNVGFYDLLSIYCNNRTGQSGLRILGTANMCSKLVSVAAGSPADSPAGWEPAVRYVPPQAVIHRGKYHMCIEPNSGEPPGDPRFWLPYETATYGIYLNGQGIQVHGMEIEAVSSEAVPLSMQNNTDVNGAVFALADGQTLDHVWEVGANAAAWKLDGVNYVFGKAATAQIKNGNGRRADGTYFAGNATGAGAAGKPHSSAEPHGGEGGWSSDTNGQRLQAFTLRLINTGDTLHHRISEPGGIKTNFAAAVRGSTAANILTPTGDDGTTGFAGGGKIGSATPSVFWFDTRHQAVADMIGVAVVSHNSTGTALNAVASVASANIDGVRMNRLCFQLSNAETGVNFDLNTANIQTGKIVQVSWLGNLSN